MERRKERKHYVMSCTGVTNHGVAYVLIYDWLVSAER
jgi:hypothetical protein